MIYGGLLRFEAATTTISNVTINSSQGQSSPHADALRGNSNRSLLSIQGVENENRPLRVILKDDRRASPSDKPSHEPIHAPRPRRDDGQRQGARDMRSRNVAPYRAALEWKDKRECRH